MNLWTEPIVWLFLFAVICNIIGIGFRVAENWWPCMERWINGDGSPAYPPLPEVAMVEINESGGTALMSPEEIKQERERRTALRDFADQQRYEQQKNMWHLFSYTLPFAALILGACFVGICVFVSLKIMGGAWVATTWH